ncbi:uncharacterized protein LOC129235980 isoform X2 [Anastrepha obliqua]|uniref:uncharacterized protein LOC129235980 isoform X2 n=1 Tax=Anastrepha obliqua TaxID=95512 RepID=UPI00240946EF|nr:uncharacterized protein LOC129235980 isoform X2 [Anastrepha obliqua]
MRKRTSDYYSSDTEQILSEDIGAKASLLEEYQDIFLMRPQMQPNYDDSFKEAKLLYDNGNEEVQQLLLKECSLIYECKKCRNMFRSLTQFIGHKRVFCRSEVRSHDDNTEGDNYNGFSSSHVMAAKEICNNTNSRCESVLQKTGEAVQQTRTLCESSELMGEKALAGECTDQLVEQEKIKNMLACPQDDCTLSFSNTKELEIHFSQDHTPTVFTSTVEQNKQEQQTQTMPDHTVITRAKRTLSHNYHKCEHCGKMFELIEALTTHLLHCPIKHNILSRTLAAGIDETRDIKRIKLQATTESTAEVPDTCAEAYGQQPEEVDKAATLAVIVEQAGISQENCVSKNMGIASKKRKMKHRKILTSKISTDLDGSTQVDDTVQIKQEICNDVPCTTAKVKSECSTGSDGSDLEPKKLLSTCTYCDKSFERRAALSTHLQHCEVKQCALEKTSIYGMSACPKRSKPHSSLEKSSKETRLQSASAVVAEDPDTELLNELFANLGRQDFGVGLQTVTIDQDDLTASGTEEAKEDVVEAEQVHTPSKLTADSPVDQNVTDADILPGIATNESTPEGYEEDTEKKTGRRMRTAPMEKRLLCRCKICYKQFTALSNLRRHISMFHYRAQRFGCTLCEYRAFRRYDIVNHLGNTHGMKGDPEQMSIEFVSEHEVNYSREDVEGDIVVLDEDNSLCAVNGSIEDIGSLNETKPNLKRLKRNKAIAVSSGLSVVISKLTRQKLKRSQSQHETCQGGVKTPARRPIRNRIKPENKDFVYDLSSLVKKDNNVVQSDVTRTLRRRNTMNANSADGSLHCIESLLGSAASRDHIRGAAQRLASSVISSGAAASATQPELPTERPQMRTRLISTQRADNHSVPVIEASELEAARLRSTLLDDTFLDKVAKASPTSFRIKPSLSLHTSTLNWLLEKVDSSLHQNANGKSSPSETLCSDDNSINSLHVSPPPSIPRESDPPPTPRKRISVLGRLRDESFKYRDSLLRSALEN